jgi:hypothetical protein
MKFQIADKWSIGKVQSSFIRQYPYSYVWTNSDLLLLFLYLLLQLAATNIFFLPHNKNGICHTWDMSMLLLKHYIRFHTVKVTKKQIFLECLIFFWPCLLIESICFQLTLLFLSRLIGSEIFVWSCSSSKYRLCVVNR